MCSFGMILCPTVTWKLPADSSHKGNILDQDLASSPRIIVLFVVVEKSELNNGGDGRTTDEYE